MITMDVLVSLVLIWKWACQSSKDPSLRRCWLIPSQVLEMSLYRGFGSWPCLSRRCACKRRKTNGGKTVKQRHVNDIRHLVCSIKSKTSVPRILLQNGKWSRDELSVSQARHEAMSERTTTDQSHCLLETSCVSEPDMLWTTTTNTTADTLTKLS